MWKSGASILHGHAQVTCTRDRHYARVEQLRTAAEQYRTRCGLNYFHDLIEAHRSLGLTIQRGPATLMASLTPIKEKEIWIVADEHSGDLDGVIYDALECFTRTLGVVSFNLVAYMPPLRPVPESWDGFPFIIRIVDRGTTGQQDRRLRCHGALREQRGFQRSLPDHRGPGPAHRE